MVQQVPILFLRALAVWNLINLHSSFANGDMAIAVVFNSSEVRGDLHPFWRSTGFCPPQPHNDGSFDLSPDMAQNLAYIGALPFNGITQVRIHWLLDLIRVASISSAGPMYNFKLLDSLVESMHQNGLAFGFELMGSPSHFFTDFENRTQVYWFRDLITVLAVRYIEKYGLSYVQKWNFETWNEPDCHDFDKMKFSVQGFLNYYDACSEGLQAAHPSLVLGGPGDACWPDSNTRKLTKSRVLFDALLDHAIHGTNYFTGKKGVRLDFISVHEKGDAQGYKILEREISASKYINSKYPELADKPFYNDEADPLVGWSRPLEWRANVKYAALIAKVIVQHVNILGARSVDTTSKYLRNYALLSNDNAFMSYYPNQFTQRTLLARFQINSTSNSSSSLNTLKQNYTTFIRKPSYLLMALLSLLGEKQIHLNITKYGKEDLTNSSAFGMLGTVHLPKGMTKTSDSWQITYLAYGGEDPGKNKSKALVGVKFHIVPPKDVKSLKIITYHLQKFWGDPYSLWKEQFNSPKFPTLEQLKQLREAENPVGVLKDVPLKKGSADIQIDVWLEDPYVMFIHICAQPAMPPEKVVGLRLLNITAGQVMIVWSDENIRTKCISTYSVEWSASSPKGPFTRINKYDIMANVFLHETDSEKQVQGFYRVRAVDYWKRSSPASDIVSYHMPV